MQEVGFNSEEQALMAQVKPVAMVLIWVAVQFNFQAQVLKLELVIVSEQFISLDLLESHSMQDLTDSIYSLAISERVLLSQPSGSLSDSICLINLTNYQTVYSWIVASSWVVFQRLRK